jgi:uncharacterized protein
MAEDVAELFAKIRDFEWDPAKREQILRKRHIDFQDARLVFAGPTYIRRSDRKGEARYMVFGFLEDIEVVVVCTLRGNSADICHVISARRARRDERKKYHAHFPRRSKEG